MFIGGESDARRACTEILIFGRCPLWSKADMCSVNADVRFGPTADITVVTACRPLPCQSPCLRHHSPEPHVTPPTARSLHGNPPCGAAAHVCFGPKADIGSTSDEHSDAWQDNTDVGELARLCIDLD